MVTNLVGPPVRGENCYGREPFLRILWQKLEGEHVLLAAPRRFGKTSVLYRLIDEPRGGFRFVHADLQHLTEPAEFITHLVTELARDSELSQAVSRLSYFPTTAWTRFRRTFDEVELLNFRIKLRDQLRPRWQESGEELFRRVGTSDQPVVFILDEFPMMIDRMARSPERREEAKTMLRWLRALRIAPGNRNVRFIIAGSIGIDHVLNELGEIAAVNDFARVRLEPFAPKVARAFLDQLCATHDLPLNATAKRRMLELIGTLVPYFIQILFSEAAKAYALDRKPPTPASLTRLYHDRVLGVDCKTYFDHYYGRLRDYYPAEDERAAKRILRELAVSGALRRDSCYQMYRAEAGDAGVEAFNRVMTDLENDFYIRYEAEAQQYEFASKLLRDWWLRHYALEAG